jgi:hypothetical protein
LTDRFDWRKHLAVHPAAETYDLMSEAELKELADDIHKNGLGVSIVICTPLSRDDFPLWRRRESLETKQKREASRKTWKLLDGRNRLDALAEISKRALLEKEQMGELLSFCDDDILGIEDGELNLADDAVVKLYHVDDAQAYALVASYNEHRRHLTPEQRREAIAKRLKATPEKSNNQIAKEVKADDKTVARVRTDLESTSEIPKLERTVGADGKARKQRDKKKVGAAAKPQPAKINDKKPPPPGADIEKLRQRPADQLSPMQKEALAQAETEDAAVEEVMALIEALTNEQRSLLFARLKETKTYTFH